MSSPKVKLNNALLAEANSCQSQVSITGVRCQSQANRYQSQVPESTNKPHRGEIILEMDMNEVIDQVVGSHQSREAVAVRPAFTHFNRTLRLCALLRTPISTTNIVSCDSTFAFFVLAFHWVNVFKFCAVYTQLQSDSFGPKFFTLIIVHILTLQTASCATMFVFPFSRTFPKLLKRWSTYKKLYGGLSVYYIKRVIIMSVVFVWTLAASTYTLFCTVGVFYGRNVKSLDLMHRSILIPFYQEGDVPIYLYALAVCLFHMYIFVAAAQLFSLSVLCYFLKREFKDITVVLEADIKRKDDHLLNIEHYRQRHNAVAALVSTLDDMVSGYLAVEYGTDIPVLIFTVYCFIYSGDFTDSAQSIMTLMAVPSISVMAWLGICTGCSAMIHTAAMGPKKILYDLNMQQHQAAGRSLEIQTFLSKLTSEHIGLTAWKLFNINKTTLISIACLFLTYMVILMKFGLSLQGCTSRVDCANITGIAHNCLKNTN